MTIVFVSAAVITHGCVLPEVEAAPAIEMRDSPTSAVPNGSGSHVSGDIQRSSAGNANNEPPHAAAVSGAAGATENESTGASGASGASNGPAAGTANSSTGGAGALPEEPRGVSLEYHYALWPMPDALLGAKTPPSYTVGSETVTDDVTQLVWQRSVPASYAGCSGRTLGEGTPPGSACTWDEADNYCKSAALAASLGGEDWRLPTKIELESILDETRRSPATNSDAFPNLTPESHFWTATRYVGTVDYYWHISFLDGYHGANRIHDDYHVRCVRSTMRVPTDALVARYDIGDELVTDGKTGLSWQRDADSEMRSWNDADAYCRELTLAGGGWRLPAYKEMLTLVDPTHSDPAVDTRAFPKTSAEAYWTASPCLDSMGYRSVDFHAGSMNGNSADPCSSADQYFVRCVR